jgi:hypothetical protein
VTLDPRPLPPKVVPESEPEPTPAFVALAVINRNTDIEITRPSRDRLHPIGVTTRYKAGRVLLVDRAGQRHFEYVVDARDVDNFLRGVDGAYRPGHAPVGGRAFSEED